MHLIAHIKRVLVGVSLLFGMSVAHAGVWSTWAEMDEDHFGIQIYLAYLEQSQVTSIHQLSHQGANVTPSLALDQAFTWVVWVDRASAVQYQLNFAQLDTESKRLLQVGVIQTKDAKIYAPSIDTTVSGHPIVAWSGFDGHDEEIRLSHYIQGQWTTETPITDNQIPDTKPFFTSGEQDQTLLNWEQISSSAIQSQSTLIKAEPSHAPVHKKIFRCKASINPANVRRSQMPESLELYP